jgi:hypothetical protein
MPATTRTPLGASTTNRKWYLDVNTGTTATPTWTAVHGMTEFTPAFEVTLQDDSDFDSAGHKSQTATAGAWSITGTLVRKVTAASATAYDAGQEALRLAGAEFGAANSVEVRWYEMEPNGPRVEAYSGKAAVSWSPQGGAMDALSTVSFTLTGQGRRSAIAHPTTVL